MRRRVSLLLLLASTLACGPSAGHATGPPLEARCAELGSDCICSEPLDNADAIPDRGHIWNPGDSEGAAARECERTQAAREAVPSMVVPAAVGASFPDPARDPGHVLQYEGKNVFVLPMRGDATVRERSLCGRAYLRHAPDFSAGCFDACPGNPLDCGGNCSYKFFRFNASNADLVGSLPSGESPQPTSDEKFTLTLITLGPGLPLFQGSRRSQQWWLHICRDHWCRVEQCVDHGRSGASGELRVRMRITALDPAGSSETVTLTSDKTYPRGISFSDVKLEMGHDRKRATDLESLNRLWISHVMFAQADPTDGEFWIGPAAELEGDPAPR
jgi:hypothetical protein